MARNKAPGNTRVDTEATALANRTCVAQARARAGPSMATAVTARHRAPQSQRDGNPGVLFGVSSRNRAKSPDLRALSRLCSRAWATPARPTEVSQCSEEQAALPPNGMCRESPGSPPGSSETSSAREAPQVPRTALPCPGRLPNTNQRWGTDRRGWERRSCARRRAREHRREATRPCLPEHTGKRLYRGSKSFSPRCPHGSRALPPEGAGGVPIERPARQNTACRQTPDFQDCFSCPLRAMGA